MFANVLRNSIKKIENMKVGVIGTGWWGKNIVRTLEGLQDVSHIYIFDSSQEAYKKLPDLTKGTIVNSLRKITENTDIQAVCIATPPQTHFSLAKEILLSGKNVLIEKPPVLKIEQLMEIGNLVTKTGLVFMLDALFLFLEPIIKLKHLINSDLLSSVKYVEMFRNGDEFRREGAGLKRIQQTMFNNDVTVIDDLFFHDAGILLNIFDDLEIQSIRKYFIYNSTLCDSVKIEFSTSQNIPIELTESWTFARKRGIKVYCENHIIEYDGFANENQLSVFDLEKHEYKFYNFKPTPPLTSMIQYFIKTIGQPDTNSMGIDFVNKLTKLWLNVKNE